MRTCGCSSPCPAQGLPHRPLSLDRRGSGPPPLLTASPSLAGSSAVQCCRARAHGEEVNAFSTGFLKRLSLLTFIMPCPTGGNYLKPLKGGGCLAIFKSQGWCQVQQPDPNRLPGERALLSHPSAPRAAAPGDLSATARKTTHGCCISLLDVSSSCKLTSNWDGLCLG